MAETDVVVRTGVGLHARPAAALVQEAAKHAGDVFLEFEGRTANAKSILEVLSLGVADGRKVLVRATGDGAEEVLSKVATLLGANPGT